MIYHDYQRLYYHGLRGHTHTDTARKWWQHNHHWVIVMLFALALVIAGSL